MSFITRGYQKLTRNLGKDDTKTVQIKYNRINEKEMSQFRYDINRDNLNKQLQKDACRAVLDYLKFHNEKVSPPLPSLNEKKLTRSVFTANLELLDKLAYASLKSYSYTLNGSAPQNKKPPTNITKLSSLVGGKWSQYRLTHIGSWDDKDSEIGNDEVTVTFEFDFSNVHKNKDLLKWQGKLPEEPEQQSASSNYDPYPTGPGRGDYSYDPNPHPDDRLDQRELMERAGLDVWQLGGKSTRRRQSNTHRRIKQKKRKTKKNNSRRRKNTRK